MRTKLLAASACALLSVGNALTLTRPASAAQPTPAEFGCTLEEFALEIRNIHAACRAAGYDGGTVMECNGTHSVFVCWYL